MISIHRIFPAGSERRELDAIVKKGKNVARGIFMAMILLFCDLSPEGMEDKRPNKRGTQHLRENQ